MLTLAIWSTINGFRSYKMYKIVSPRTTKRLSTSEITEDEEKNAREALPEIVQRIVHKRETKMDLEVLSELIHIQRDERSRKPHTG